MTKMSKVAEVSPPVPVGDTSRVIYAFSLQFDRYYGEMQQQIVDEYVRMRTKYMELYQNNLELNTSVKEERLV